MILTDTVALVTGAGRRLGRAIALGLGEAGCDVIVHYGKSREGAEETAETIRVRGNEGIAVRADLSDPREIAALFEAVEDRFGRLDILVNSAASFERAPFDEITVEAWDAVLDLNLRAPFLCAQRAARLMRRTAGRKGLLGETDAPGAIMNLADHAGVTTWRGYAHHGVSKAGLLHLTRIAARELAPDVRVNSVIPGPILPPSGESPDSEEWRARGERVPLRRTGDPAHVLEAVLFLTRNDYVTGAELFVDGGERLLPGGRA